MKLKIIQTRNFSKTIDYLLRKRLLSKEDFDFFQKKLAEDPALGIMIPGTGGIRKIRLKSSSKGKRGGFRVCYYYLVEKALYLLLIYGKNQQEDLTTNQKKELRELIRLLKETSNE